MKSQAPARKTSSPSQAGTPRRPPGKQAGAATRDRGSQGAGSSSVAAEPNSSPRRRGVTPLTPMRVQAAKSMSKLADNMKEAHPDLPAHTHVRDAARMLRVGNEEASQRHLRAAMFSLTPQSLMRNGMHTDDAHMAARTSMHGVHRHLLLVKDIQDAGDKNRAVIARHAGEDATDSPALPDPNAGYGPGALAQKPVQRQPGGNQAMNAPARNNSGGSDPNVANPVGKQPRGSKQFARTWDELASVIDLIGGG